MIAPPVHLRNLDQSIWRQLCQMTMVFTKWWWMETLQPLRWWSLDFITAALCISYQRCWVLILKQLLLLTTTSYYCYQELCMELLLLEKKTHNSTWQVVVVVTHLSSPWPCVTSDNYSAFRARIIFFFCMQLPVTFHVAFSHIELGVFDNVLIATITEVWKCDFDWRIAIDPTNAAGELSK